MSIKRSDSAGSWIACFRLLFAVSGFVPSESLTDKMGGKGLSDVLAELQDVSASV